jgi:transposase InsO family protein
MIAVAAMGPMPGIVINRRAASSYRLLKAHDLTTSPAYVVIKAADRFHTRTTRINEMWQTDFTYFKIIGWGCRILGRLPPAVSSSSLSIDRARRLLALHHRLEAVHQHAGRGCDRHVGLIPTCNDHDPWAHLRCPMVIMRQG